MGICNGLEVSFVVLVVRWRSRWFADLLVLFSYALQWLVVLPLEIIAASITVGYWGSDMNRALFVTIFLLTIIIINLFGVKGYGEAEFVFALVKITAVIGFM